jgi:hypothetical protein
MNWASVDGAELNIRDGIKDILVFFRRSLRKIRCGPEKNIEFNAT